VPRGGPGQVVSEVGRSVRGMIIDCGTCTVRGDACADCVVTFLTIPVRSGAPAAGPRAASGRSVVPGAPPGSTADPMAATETETLVGAPTGPDLDDAERAAIAVLAGQGLVPPLRLVRAV
jgi:hypothetical protein